MSKLTWRLYGWPSVRVYSGIHSSYYHTRTKDGRHYITVGNEQKELLPTGWIKDSHLRWEKPSWIPDGYYKFKSVVDNRVVARRYGGDVVTTRKRYEDLDPPYRPGRYSGSRYADCTMTAMCVSVTAAYPVTIRNWSQ